MSDGKQSRVALYAVVAGVIGVVILVVAVFVTRSVLADHTPAERTRVTFEARSPDGSPPSRDALAQTQKIVEARVHDLGVHGSDVKVDGNQVIVTVPGTDVDQVRRVAQSGVLYVRPVRHTIASSGSGSASTSPAQPTKDVEQLIADEKALRQSTDPQIQVLALQFQATRCGNADVLAGRDDPNLPLVTCSEDGKEVYLLEKSIISGQQVDLAKQAQQGGENAVDVAFNHDAAQVLSRFSNANLGNQLAYTLNSRVLSAPTFGEAIPDGRIQITGGFTADSARKFADAVNRGTLPLTLTFESATTETP
ncbi:MAG: preprotein translocase subunit SecD [Mycobacterium sp.]|jgi:protein-export membrane protein SecD|nr:preprotein translocase subunit SecD [Mycobacterium sp.]